MAVDDCRIIMLPEVFSENGNLIVIEGIKHIPFEVKRIFYLYDVPSYAKRGSHAHKHCQQFIIALSGSFEIYLDDACQKKDLWLNNAFFGLYVPSMIWCELGNFSPGSICLVLASNLYDESDYIRNYEDFIKVAQ